MCFCKSDPSVTKLRKKDTLEVADDVSETSTAEQSKPQTPKKSSLRERKTHQMSVYEDEEEETKPKKGMESIS